MARLLILLLLLPVIGYSQKWSQIESSIPSDGFEVSSSMVMSDNGDFIAVGYAGDDLYGEDAGKVTVFKLANGLWQKVGGEIYGKKAGESIGRAVSLSSDGKTIAIGGFKFSLGTPDMDKGRVRVYELVNGSWKQKGGDIDGEALDDNFGGAVSLSSNGDIVAIGGGQNDGNGSDAGHVRVMEFNGTAWVQIGQDIDGDYAGDMSGSSVSLSADGSIVAIGAYSSRLAGQVRVFKNLQNNWVQVGGDIVGEFPGDRFGYAVSLNDSGNVVAIGAPYNDGNLNQSGHTRVFKFANGNWTQIGNDIDGKGVSDNSGKSVSLSASGNIVAIGAPYNRDNGEEAGLVRIYENRQGIWSQLGGDIYGMVDNQYGEANSISLSADGQTIAIGEDGPSGEVNIFKLCFVNTNVVIQASTITSQAVMASFQWMDCSTNKSIQGETNQSFIPSQNGSYKVVITQNGCVDTSDCYTISNVGERSVFHGGDELTISPNPTSGEIEVSFSKVQSNASLVIYNSSGQEVIQKSMNNSTDCTISLNGSPGIYLITLTSQSGATKYFRVVKE